MSTRADSTKKPNVFNEANEALYDPYIGFPVREIFTDIPWPEWSDAELNSEVWEEPRSKSTLTTARKSVSSTFSSSAFEDLSPPDLPLVIKEYATSWKRPQDVFPDSALTVYHEENLQFELVVPSPVAACGFFKLFDQLLPILQFYAIKYGFPVEMETPSFSSNTQGEPWHPWHHIYALCKAGKSQPHRPLYNPYGKYVIRLFYLGSWRKFVIDDKIPCDKYGNCMLPVTQISGELWPILLAKGLLKITSLISGPELPAADFPFVSFFTGWVQMNLTTLNKTQNQIWRRIRILTPRYEISSDEQELKTAPASLKDASKKGSSKREAVKDSVKQSDQKCESVCVLFATLGGFPLDVEPGDIQVLVTMNRDVPLQVFDKREPTKPWKRLRWVHWASEKGIWMDELALPPYRRLQCVTFAKKLGKILTPDPKQEATLYNVPKGDVTAERSHLGFGDASPYEPRQWSDFFKFCDYLTEMNASLKPSSFVANFRISCFGSALATRSTTPATAKTATKPEPQNSYFYSSDLTPTLNCPVVLYCESLTAIVIVMSLSVCPRVKKYCAGYLDPQNPEVLKIGHASLVVEKCDWKTLLQGDLLGYMKTVGNSTIYLSLKPGRHILRLWLNSDSPYALNMYSNVDLCVHKGPKIRYLMSKESERILQYVSVVSEAFIALTQKFGKADLPLALRTFYEAIKPGNDTAVDYFSKLDDFIDCFLNCIMLALKNLISNKDELKIMLAALRSLFVNPRIECDLPGGTPASLYGSSVKKTNKKVVIVLKERTLSEILQYPWSAEEIAQVIFIQRMFRGYRARLLWKCQTPVRKEFKPFAERLKKICDTLFSPGKRDVEVAKLIRTIGTVDPDLMRTFKFHEDFSNVIQVEEYSGKVAAAEPFAWIPLARFIIASHGTHPVPCAFYFSCNLEQFFVTGTNNDTNEEIFSLTNTISPHWYRSNAKGYTVFIFGWNEANTKTVNWRLEMVKVKYIHMTHLCNTMTDLSCHPYAMPVLEVNEVKNFYIPNRKSLVCRCSIRIRKRTLLTLRFSVSYPEADFLLTVSSDGKHCCLDSESSVAKDPVQNKYFSRKGSVCLFSLVLENLPRHSSWGETDEESTLYILEAHVLNNSWPLTRHEWGVIEPMRVNGEPWKDSNSSLQLRKSVSDSRKKVTRMSKRSLQERNVENPCWVLQVLKDSSEGDSTEAMVVEEDRSYYESIKAMKCSWEEKNPGRRKKGRDIRLNFLRSIYSERRTEVVDEGIFEKTDEAVIGETSGEDDFKELLHKMTSFSYLTNDKSCERHLKSPRVLPRTPMEDILQKYKRTRHFSVGASTSDSTFSDGSRFFQRNVEENEEEDRRDFLNMCSNYRLILMNHMAEEQQLSSELMSQAYRNRSKVVQRMAG